MLDSLKSIVIILSLSLLFGGCSFTNSEEKYHDIEVEISGKEEQDKANPESNKEINISEEGRQGVLEAYEEKKSDLGKYYYIWDSSKYEIPLLLITDYIVTDTEDVEIFGMGTASECRVYYSDPDNEFEIKEMGKLDALSTSYPVACSDEGLFVANDHFVYQFVPDYKNCTLTLWRGFEDDVVNIAKEHEGWVEFVDGEVVGSDDVDTDMYFNMYHSAIAVSFGDTFETKKP